MPKIKKKAKKQAIYSIKNTIFVRHQLAILVFSAKNKKNAPKQGN
jgi:hypothetical protein